MQTTMAGKQNERQIKTKTFVLNKEFCLNLMVNLRIFRSGTTEALLSQLVSIGRTITQSERTSEKEKKRFDFSCHRLNFI